MATPKVSFRMPPAVCAAVVDFAKKVDANARNDGPTIAAIFSPRKVLTAEEVWSGVEDVHEAWRGPVLDGVVALWARASAL